MVILIVKMRRYKGKAVSTLGGHDFVIHGHIRPEEFSRMVKVAASPIVPGPLGYPCPFLYYFFLTPSYLPNATDQEFLGDPLAPRDRAKQLP